MFGNASSIFWLFVFFQNHGLSLAAKRKLLRLRLALAEFCLVLLEEHCCEEKDHAVASIKKTSVEIKLDEFIRCTPEPNSIEQVKCLIGHLL